MNSGVRQKLAEMENNFKLLTDNAADVIWIYDVRAMQYVYVSPSTRQLRGYTAEEVLGQELDQVLTPASFNAAMTALQEELVKFQQGKASKRTMELEMTRKDGSTVWTEVTTCLYREESGAIMVVGITRDISERKWRDDEKQTLLMEMRATLEDKERLLRENKILYGLLPICANCRKIRDEKGDWHDLEAYIASRTEADFQRIICPDCQKVRDRQAQG